jgi:hypothetical protein
MRWQLEVTFQEVRRHLGFETQRQWSDLAIRRTTPALLGLFSLITLFAHQRMTQSTEAVRRVGHGTANLTRPSQMLWNWYAANCGPVRLFASRLRTATR